MEQQIKVDKVLEFKALTMNKRIFEQVREVRAPQVVSAPGLDQDIDILGWVFHGNQEHFLYRLDKQLVRLTRQGIWDGYFDKYTGIQLEEMAKAAGFTTDSKLPSYNLARIYIETAINKWRDNLPQIFLK